MVSTLLLVVTLAPAPLVASADRGAARPMIAYYFIDNIYDKQHQIGEVLYWSDYYLEDGTYIGRDTSGWVGPVTQSHSLIETIAIHVGAGIGGMIGESLGAWLGVWVASQVAIDASYATYAFAIGAMSAGPWLGFGVGVAAGTV